MTDPSGESAQSRDLDLDPRNPSQAGEGVHPLRRRIEESIAQMHGYRSLDDVGPDDDGFYGEIADAIIADLGFEQVGWYRSAERFLWHVGLDGGHAHHRDEPVYRLADTTHSGRTEQ